MSVKLEKMNAGSPFGEAEWLTFGEEAEVVIAETKPSAFVHPRGHILFPPTPRL